MRLGHKISVGIFILVTALLVSVMSIVDWATRRAVEEKIRRDIETAAGVLERFHHFRLSTLLKNNQLLAQAPFLKALAITSDLDPALIEHIAESIRRNLQSDFTFILDPSGKSLGGAGEKSFFDSGMAQAPAIGEALKGNPFQGIWPTQEAVLQLVLSPLAFEDGIVGVLVSGFVLNADAIRTFEQMANARVAVNAGEKWVAMADSAALFEGLKQKYYSDGSAPFRKVVLTSVEGEDYLHVKVPFSEGSETSYILARSLDKERAFYRILQRRLFLITGVILAAALFAGLLLSYRITRPIQALVQGSKKIAEGDLSARVEVSRRDEIGDLARSFNTMAEALKATTVTKSYVQDVLKSMLNSVTVISPEGKIEMANESMCALLGYQEKELLGKPARFFLGKRQEEELLQSLAEQNAGTPPQAVEMIYWARNRMEIPVLFLGAPLKDRNRRTEGYVCVALDMRECKRLEEKLLESEKLASIGQFIAGLSHEMNSSLIVILRHARRLLEGNRDSQTSDSLKIVEKRAAHCHRIAQDLLTFARRRPLNLEPINLCIVIDEMIANFRLDFERMGINIRRNYPKNLIQIKVDHDQMRELFTNLFQNARDALEPLDHGREIAVSVKPDKDSLLIALQDNGIGIASENYNQIFEPFFTTKEIGKGTGLGLSLCYGIVKKHKGNIRVESQAGKGATFYITLPLKTPETKFPFAAAAANSLL